MYNVTLQQIETFLVIARYRNLSKASEAMFISQPALSKMIQRFEDGLGMRLFVRGNQGVTLTPEGEYLYVMLDPLFAKMNKIFDTGKAISNSSERILNMAVPSSIDISTVYHETSQYVKQFREAYPNIILKESLMEFSGLRQTLEFGEADVVIAPNFVIRGVKNISFKRISEFQRYLALAVDHPLAQYDKPPLDRFHEETFYRVAFNEAYKDKSAYMEDCRAFGITPKEIVIVDNVQTQIHNILENGGCSISTRFDFFGRENKIKYYPLPEPASTHVILAAWKTGYLPPEAHLFINMLPAEEERS